MCNSQCSGSPCCQCFLGFFSSFVGKIFVFIIAICLILLGILTIWGFIWISFNHIFITTISDSISSTVKAIDICLGIAMVLFGIAGIFGAIYRKGIVGKVLLSLYLIGSIIIFLFFAILGGILIAFLTSKGLISDHICNQSNPSISVRMYDNIKERTNYSDTCPLKCIDSNTNSQKLLDCHGLQMLLNVPESTYSASHFKSLAEVESTYKCAGLCKKHEGIPCTFFTNFSQKSTRTCIGPIEESLQKYDRVVIVIYSISLPVIFFNILATIALLCYSSK